MRQKKNVGKPCEGKPHARFDEGKEGKKPSNLLYHGNIACDISEIQAKELCEAPAMHGRRVCKGICDLMLRAFYLEYPVLSTEGVLPASAGMMFPNASAQVSMAAICCFTLS